MTSITERMRYKWVVTYYNPDGSVDKVIVGYSATVAGCERNIKRSLYHTQWFYNTDDPVKIDNGYRVDVYNGKRVEGKYFRNKGVM